MDYFFNLFLGVHSYSGQRVERLQTLHRVPGASQRPEEKVPTGGHLHLPTQESLRKQGGFIVHRPISGCFTVKASTSSQLEDETLHLGMAPDGDGFLNRRFFKHKC